MKYFIIAGERSGDLHGSNLIKAIQSADNQSVVRAWGGELMKANGAEVLKNYGDLAFMGFLEVAQNFFKILGFFKECKSQITDFQPDAVILIDYAGFNLRIAKWAKKQGFKVFYYISPKVWAWNQNRALAIKKSVDKLFVIFPFEVDFFKKYNFEVEYVGNPLLDAINDFRPNPDFKLSDSPLISDNKIIALLPGSRKQEVEKMLQTMTKVALHFPHYQFVIAGVGNLSKSFYQQFVRFNVKIVFDQTYDLLMISEAALVASGTATLETALFEVPQVVCYKSSFISYQIAKRLIRVPYIALVNLIAQKEVVKELIQENFTVQNVKNELEMLLSNTKHRESQIVDYQKIKLILNKKNASQNVGNRIVEILKTNKPNKQNEIK